MTSAESSKTEQVVALDIGCRGGVVTSWFLPGAPPVRVYAFDADADECARLQELYASSHVTFVPLALADVPGQRTLYLTRNPGCNSLYQPDRRFTERLRGLKCARQIGTTEIDVSTLDLWASGASIDRIDCIKLDTQGTELDILKGGAQCLTTVRALVSEVEFNPYYLNQPLFGDIDAYLRPQGFVLLQLSSFTNYPRKGPSQLFWGHATYVREEMVSGRHYGDSRQHFRDAAVFRLFGFPEHAELHLQMAREHT